MREKHKKTVTSQKRRYRIAFAALADWPASRHLKRIMNLRYCSVEGSPSALAVAAPGSGGVPLAVLLRTVTCKGSLAWAVASDRICTTCVPARSVSGTCA